MNADAVNKENVHEVRVCKECGREFIITKGEFEDLKKRCGEKFALPLRCHDCRAKKGQIFRTCTCKKCGEEFSISLLEKDDYMRKGLELPKHCMKCRVKMRRPNRRHFGRRQANVNTATAVKT